MRSFWPALPGLGIPQSVKCTFDHLHRRHATYDFCVACVAVQLERRGVPRHGDEEKALRDYVDRLFKRGRWSVPAPEGG